MERITGIGGVFLEAKDPKAMAAWYRDNLGLELDWEHGKNFEWQAAEKAEGKGPGTTVWSLFAAPATYFAPSRSPVMVNYRVRDLDAMVAQLEANGVPILGRDKGEYGGFAWVVDPEGNKLELWEPPASAPPA